MSDDKTILDDLEYLAVTTPNATCPMCQNKAWAFPRDSILAPRTAYVSYGDSDPESGEKIQLPAIPLTCTKCGYMRLHDRGMIRKIMNKAGKNV